MMDKQQEQMNQNPKQEVELTSDFLEEVVEESDFDEPEEEQEGDKLADSEQSKPDGKEQPKKIKRPRKTIEQELAELDARRQRLMEKKRSQETHEKIVFGATVIAMLKVMYEKNDGNGEAICDLISSYAEVKQKKFLDIINKIISEIKINK